MSGTKHTVCLIGNPNCGKTTLFNQITGSKQEVGNWPGVTVEKKSGFYSFKGRDYELVDLPGIYSVTPSRETGEDERVARDYLLSGEPEAVVNIVDAGNLSRNLYLTAQLLEMRVPMIVAVNMMDVAEQHHTLISLDRLSSMLGCPVIGLEANKGNGVGFLKRIVNQMTDSRKIPPLGVRYPEDIERAIEAVAGLFEKSGVPHCRWNATQALEGAPLPKTVPESVKEQVPALCAGLASYGNDLDIAISAARYELVGRLIEGCVRQEREIGQTVTDKIDRVVLHRVFGIPFFLIMMYLMFSFTMNVGGAFIDFFGILSGGIFVDGFGRLLASAGCPDWLRALLADGVGGGIQTVSTFIPVIFCLFLFLSLLEDSGYMARGAFVMDRLMRAVGLPGRAFIPLIVGFGCGVPAIMGTRTLNRFSDRVITALMVPFMSCGARLPVYVLFGAVFFGKSAPAVIFGIYLLGILAAAATAWLLRKNAFTGRCDSFIMEIPPYHVPTLRSLWANTWDRLRDFIGRAGVVITGVVVVLNFLSACGTDGTFSSENSEKSVLSYVGKTVTPVFAPMGITSENWPATVGLFTGVLAKETVIGTLNSLYGAKAGTEETPQNAEEAPWSLREIFSSAAGSAAYELKQLVRKNETESVSEENAETGSASVMKRLFGSKAAAFAYMLMILLYLPCSASLGTIWREVGTKWTLFAGAWTMSLAYSVSTVFYQANTFGDHPVYSGICIGCCTALIALMVGVMRRMNASEPKRIPIRAE